MSGVLLHLRSSVLPRLLCLFACAPQFDCDGDRRDFAKQQVWPSCSSCTGSSSSSSCTGYSLMA